jgi:FtsH-binding integral membrane protein
MNIKPYVTVRLILEKLMQKTELLVLYALLCSVIARMIFEGDRLLTSISIIVIFIFFGWIAYKTYKAGK